jgi:formylglycine-generating enzyme required for sulfatase activity
MPQAGRIAIDAAVVDNAHGRWFLPGAGKTESFKDCPNCPEMVVAPAGSFTMGSPENEPGRKDNEGPLHEVTIDRPFAVGRFPVTFAEWDACAKDGGCDGYYPSDWGTGRGDNPVVHVNWDDMKVYVKWLSDRTGKNYRLLSEAEREYVTRAGTETPFWWGSSISMEQANCNGNYAYNGGTKGELRGKTVPVKSFRPNPWGLYQVHGNVWEPVEDCWHDNYNGSPADGSAWLTQDCALHVIRGGSWNDDPKFARAAARGKGNPMARVRNVGFRLARTITP